MNMREKESEVTLPTSHDGNGAENISVATPVVGEELIVANEQATSGTEAAKPQLSPFKEAMYRFRHNKRSMICLGIMIFLIVLALIGPPIYQHIGGTYAADLGGQIGPDVYHRPDHQELTQQDQGPSMRYWLGTDDLGEDMLARMMQGILISILVAFLVEVVDIGVGVTLGVLAGYFGGWLDTVLARFMDLIFAFPGLLFAILLSSLFSGSAANAFNNVPLIGPFMAGGYATLVVVSIALAFVGWPLMARYVRGQTLQIKQQQYIEAARAAGTANRRVMWKHIIPNLFSFVLIASSLNVAGTIIGEAGLSFLGLGVRPPGSSLGLMINDGLQTLEIHPWNALFPTLVLTILVLCISFMADGLNDAFNPRHA